MKNEFPSLCTSSLGVCFYFFSRSITVDVYTSLCTLRKRIDRLFSLSLFFDPKHRNIFSFLLFISFFIFLKEVHFLQHNNTTLMFYLSHLEAGLTLVCFPSLLEQKKIHRVEMVLRNEKSNFYFRGYLNYCRNIIILVLNKC